MPEFQSTAFVDWAQERENIRHRREDLGLPRKEWTTDPVFQKYRFCNVSREDDRGTRVVKELIRDPMTKAGADPLQVSRALAIARFFNWPDTLEELIKKEAITDRTCDLDAVFRVVTERKDRGEVVFSTAYVVGCPPGQLVQPWLGVPGKIAYVCSIVKRADFPVFAGSRQEYVSHLRQSVGFKDFMAGQVAADLYYTHVGGNWGDAMTWAPMGPGAVRGINRCMGRPVESPMSQELYLEMGRKALELLPSGLVSGRRLTLHDVNSNVFCETDKYLRIKQTPSRRVGRTYK